MRTAFHVHTAASHDSSLRIGLIYLMCKIRGIDCVAVTDHNEIHGAQRASRILESRGIQVIVGEEIFTSEGEIIGLFLKEHIAPGLTPEETIAEIRRQGGVVYVPHPYDEKRYKTVLSESAQMRLKDSFDCMEFHNGRNISEKFSDRQLEIVNNLGLQRVVGDDAHCFFEVGRNYCITEENFTVDNFSEVLKGATFHTSKCHPLAHRCTQLVRVKKMFMKGDFNALYRVLVRKFRK